MAIGWNNDELVVGFGIEKEEVCNGADKSIPVDERSGNSGPNSKNNNIVNKILVNRVIREVLPLLAVNSN